MRFETALKAFTAVELVDTPPALLRLDRRRFDDPFFNSFLRRGPPVLQGGYRCGCVSLDAARVWRVAENMREVFWLTDPAKEQVLYISPGYEDIWGRSCASLYAAPRDWVAAIHPEDRARVLAAAQDKQVGGRYEEEYRIVRPDGKVRWIRDRASPILDDSGDVYRVAGIAEDITDRKLVRDELQESERRFSDMLAKVELISLMLDRNANITYCNDYLLRLTGWRRDELIGHNWFDIFIPPEQHGLKEVFSQLLADMPEASHYENKILTRDGTRRVVRWNNTVLRLIGGEVVGTASIGEDITEALADKLRLVHQAHHDALTGLPNRVLFHDRLEQNLHQARRHGWSMGCLFVDIDQFKIVNDTSGHEVGDALLQAVAKRIAAVVRGSDTVARVGGDEFAIILAELVRPQDAAILAQKMLTALAMPLSVEDHEFFVTASIGIATYPSDGADADALLRNADAAMFRAKEEGRARYQFYTAEMNARAMENLLLRNDLRRAIDRDEFALHFQPKARLGVSEITGFEALLRWHHPTRGMVPPADFVPLLEGSGLIVIVGELVIDSACRQIAAWRDAGFPLLSVAVNLSAKQFQDRNLVAAIDASLARHRVPAELIEFEV